MNAQNGWAALHNIREVLTEFAPAGSLPDPDVVMTGPEHVHEAELLIRAIHALHERAVTAEAALAATSVSKAAAAADNDPGDAAAATP